jgi:hypothetical protein
MLLALIQALVLLLVLLLLLLCFVLLFLHFLLLLSLSVLSVSTPGGAHTRAVASATHPLRTPLRRN